MTVEESLLGALEYENRIRDLYRNAALGSREAESRALYEILGKDEQSHVDFLTHALWKWRQDGRIDAAGPETAFPSQAGMEKAIRRAASPLQEAAAGKDRGGELNALRSALAAEEETSAYYRSLASGLPGDARRVFERFVEIEEGHSSLVRAQIDCITRTGYWFDVREFDLED